MADERGDQVPVIGSLGRRCGGGGLLRARVDVNRDIDIEKQNVCPIDRWSIALRDYSVGEGVAK